jgi:hypothetical protein
MAVGYEVSYGLASRNYTSQIDAGTNTRITLSGLTPGLTYYFAVRAYNGAQDQSPYSNELIDSVPPLPLIISQPMARSVVAGARARLTVSATSPIPMSYQWYYDNAPLPGATNARLVLPNVSDANGGGYTVVISNSSGSVTSSVAALTVIDPPVILSQPVAQNVGFGGSAVFQAVVRSTAPLTFQWYDGGAAIAAGTGATLELANVSGANAGNYYAIVQNAAGAVTSANAALTITNAFVPLAGVYNGLFYQTNNGGPDIAVPTSGMLGNCIVGTNGVYNAKFYAAGGVYPLTGVLSATGNDSEVVSRAAKGLPNFSVTLSLDMTGSSRTITGLVANLSATNPWTAPLLANLATNALPVPAGEFGMLLLPQAGAANAPTADGSSSIVSGTNGIITLAGCLADETPFSQSIPVSQTGNIPFYCSLYGGSGLAEGWINLAGGVPTGSITWIRPAGVRTGLGSPLGFTNVLAVSAYSSDLAGLAGWWPFNEGSGTNTIDASGNGNEGTLINSPLWTNGVIGDALFFDTAAGSYVSAPQPLASVSSLTLALWARSSSSNANPSGTLLETTAPSYGLIYYNGSCAFVGSGRMSRWADWNSRLPDDGRWHHWAGTWNGSAGILYIDGVPEATNSTMTMNAPGSMLEIGGPGTNYYGPYSGTIDDVRIYSNALSSAVIGQIYSNGLAGAP